MGGKWESKAAKRKEVDAFLPNPFPFVRPQGRVCVDERFADLRWAGFSRETVDRRTGLSTSIKMSAKHEITLFADVLLASVIFYFGN